MMSRFLYMSIIMVIAGIIPLAYGQNVDSSHIGDSVGITVSHAQAFDWNLCAAAANHHCIQVMPSTVKGPNSNQFVVIHFPQNGSPSPSGVLSADNYTKLENDVAVMNIQVTATTSKPNLNFCPVSLESLQNQDGYISKFYVWNATQHLNLTHYIYPDFCYAETGPNTIDGSYVKPVVSPEFPTSVELIGLVAILSSIIIISAAKGLRYK